MDLKIKDVAELLQVSETTINQWIKEKKIPAYKIQNEFRFDKMEVERWMMKNGKLENSLSFGKRGLEETTGTQTYSLFRALHKGDVIHDIAGRSKEEVIANTVKQVATKEHLDADGLTELLLDRERLQSTGLGHGIAIPHTRDTFLDGKPDFITIVFPQNPIDYDALDGKPVSILFFLFASDDKRHLHLLAKIAHLCSNEQAQKFLRTKPAKSALLEYIQIWEGKLSEK
jgi:PTS system nitrogen regulatory IIA component